MNIGRSYRIMALLIVGVLALTACTSGGGAKTDTPSASATWDYFIFNPVASPTGQYAVQFADTVRERTGGRLNIVVRPPGELPYKAAEALSVAGNGSVQMADAYAGFVSGDSRAAAMTALPFLVRTADELVTSMKILEPVVQADFKQKGAEILFWYTFTAQNFFGKGPPVKSFADLKGLKVRSTSPEQQAFLKQVGASPVTINPAELPIAVQQGVVDVVLTSAFSALGLKWYELFDWAYMPDLHIGGPSYIIVNSEAMKSLPEDVRGILKQTAAEFHAKMLAEIPAGEPGDIAKLKEAGMEFYLPGPEVAQEGRQLMAPYWDSWGKDAGLEEVLKQVRSALKK